jgi:hypothetical protein
MTIGYLDGVDLDAKLIRGWVFSETLPESKITLELYIDGHFIEEKTTQYFDYSFNIPSHLIDGIKYIIDVKYKNNGQSLNKSPMEVLLDKEYQSPARDNLLPISITALKEQGKINNKFTLVVKSETFVQESIVKYSNIKEISNIMPSYVKRMYDSETRQIDEIYALELEKASLLDSEILLIENNIIAETAIEYKSATKNNFGNFQWEDGKYRYNGKKYTRKVEDKTVLLSRYGVGTYGHWLIEIFPKIHIAKKIWGNDLYYALPRGVITGRKEQNMWQTIYDGLLLEGITEDKIINTSPDNIDFSKIYHISDLGKICNISLEVIKYLETIAEKYKNPTNEYEKIYISRDDASNRRLKNEEEVVKILEEYGFKKFNCRDFSFTDQIKLFANAKQIAGILGSNMTNTVFAPRNSKLLYFSPEYFYDTFFLDIAEKKYHQWYEVRGKAMEPIQSPYHRSDFIIDIDILKKALEEMNKS